MIYKILHIAMSADHKTKSEKYLYCEREIKKEPVEYGVVYSNLSWGGMRLRRRNELYTWKRISNRICLSTDGLMRNHHILCIYKVQKL